MLDKLNRIDQILFLKINKDCSNSFFDNVMPFIREPKTWVPFYLFFLVFAILNFGKKSWMWLLHFGVTASITDFISSKIVKPAFGRPRPCLDSEFSNQVNLLANYCGGNGSFTSSHAANHFGIAMFLFITLFPVMNNRAYWFFLWAAIICFAQVYVGVHYPGDILGGALLGLLIGFGAGKLFNSRNKVLQQYMN